MIREAARGLRGRLAHLRERVARGPAILLYHRIAEETFDPCGLCVSPAHFSEHLEVLASRHEVVPLGELVRRIAANRTSRREIALTFDDGYRDNLDVALPLLQRHRLPATFFVTSGPARSHRGFWWDVLELAILRNPDLPCQIGVDIRADREAMDSCGDWDAPAPASGDQRNGSVSRRHRAFRVLHDRLIEMAPGPREAALCRILQACHVAGGTQARERVLTTEQLRALARTPGIEIGAHSVSHAMLTALPAQERAAEIHASRSDLQELIGRPVHAFAYPYGAFDSATVAATREDGVEYACTCVPTRAHALQDPLLLPRLEVADCGAEQFGRSLEWSLPRSHRS